MIEHIYVVIGSGISDIGKGWLTGAIASLLPDALPIKIDPMLNQTFPLELGMLVDGEIISEDFSTYRKLGLPVYPECNIIGGAFLLEFLQQPKRILKHGFDRDKTKKLTVADVSEYLANKIILLTNKFRKYKNIVIEIGGIITDPENFYIPGALQALGLKMGVWPEMVILGYLEHPETDTGSPARTHLIRHAIRATREKYTLPIKACFIRRRDVPKHITDAEIRDEILNIAFEVHLPFQKFVYLPNINDVRELKNIIKTTQIFNSLRR